MGMGMGMAAKMDGGGGNRGIGELGGGVLVL